MSKPKYCHFCYKTNDDDFERVNTFCHRLEVERRGYLKTSVTVYYCAIINGKLYYINSI